MTQKEIIQKIKCIIQIIDISEIIDIRHIIDISKIIDIIHINDISRIIAIIAISDIREIINVIMIIGEIAACSCPPLDRDPGDSWASLILQRQLVRAQKQGRLG